MITPKGKKFKLSFLHLTRLMDLSHSHKNYYENISALMGGIEPTSSVPKKKKNSLWGDIFKRKKVRVIKFACDTPT